VWSSSIPWLYFIVSRKGWRFKVRIRYKKVEDALLPSSGAVQESSFVDASSSEAGVMQRRRRRCGH